MSGRKNYASLQEYLNAKDQEWESLCLRCGACCGAYDDPCQHLARDQEGLYYCTIYANRLGTRKSLRGDVFDCVSITEIINTHWKNDHFCIYKRYLKTPWVFETAAKT